MKNTCFLRKKDITNLNYQEALNMCKGLLKDRTIIVCYSVQFFAVKHFEIKK